jgi:hypothetical protein
VGSPSRAPLLFTLAWLIAWPVQDEYSPRREEISALAALDAEQAWIMILGFFCAPASDRCARARAQSAHLIDKPFPKHRRPLKRPSFVGWSPALVGRLVEARGS